MDKEKFTLIFTPEESKGTIKPIDPVANTSAPSLTIPVPHALV